MTRSEIEALAGAELDKAVAAGIFGDSEGWVPYRCVSMALVWSVVERMQERWGERYYWQFTQLPEQQGWQAAKTEDHDGPIIAFEDALLATAICRTAVWDMELGA